MKCRIIELALKEYQTTEIVGPKHNPRILQYAQAIGHPEVKDDETPWCSIFANYICMQAGYLYSGQLNARSWLNVGKPTTTPEMGDIVIFWRNSLNSGDGHVGFFIKQDEKGIHVLGGNENNMVTIMPYSSSQLLGYRNVSK